MTAAGRPGGEVNPSHRYGRYIGRLPYGGTWDGGMQLKRPSRRVIVDDYGAMAVFHRCSACQRWLARDEWFSPGARNEHGRVTAWDRQCRPCKLERGRRDYRKRARRKSEKRRRHEAYKRLMADAERAARRRERNRRVAERRRRERADQVRAAQRRYQAKVAADDEARERRNARAREDYRARRVAQSLPVRKAEPARQQSGAWAGRVDASGFPALPAMPLALKVERLIRQEALGAYAEQTPWLRVSGDNGYVPAPEDIERKGAPSPREVVCARLGISSKSLREWLDGRRPTVQFDVADRVLQAAGWLWLDVWDGSEVCPNGRTVEWVFTSTDLMAA